MEPLTDDQIQDFIEKRIAYFRAILSQKNTYYERIHTNGLKPWTDDWDLTPQSNGIMPKSNNVPHLPTTNASVNEDVERQGLNCAVIKQCTAAVGLEEDGSKGSKANAELTLKSKETEYPQIMMKVPATSTKNEDESPVVLAEMSEVTMDDLTEKHPSLRLNCSLSKEEHKPLGLKINKNLDDTDQVSGVSWPINNMKEKGETSLVPVEAVGLDNVQGVTDVSENLQTKSSSVVSEKKSFQLSLLQENQNANTKNIEQQYCVVTCKKVITHSKLSSSIDTIPIPNVVSVLTNRTECLYSQTSKQSVREDTSPALSQTDLSIPLLVQEQDTLFETKGEEAHSLKFLKDPLYEDISDDEGISHLAKKTPNAAHEELSRPVFYEDISEAENPQIENISVEGPSLTQVPEFNIKQLPLPLPVQVKTGISFSSETISKTQISPKTETLDIAQHCYCPCFVDTDDDFETDQMDNEWMVIPISMSDLKFEPEDEDQDGPENNLLDDCGTGDKCDTSPPHCNLPADLPAFKPVLASASSQIEVFDTVESFLLAKSVHFKNGFDAASYRSPPEHEMDYEGEPHAPQNRTPSYSEPEDSCETEDSCDYSSGSEHNYLTVSRQLLKKRPAPLPTESDSVSEKEAEDEVANVQKGKTRSLIKRRRMQKHKLIKAKAASVQPKTKRLKLSKMDDIIILDSDAEDYQTEHSQYAVAAKEKLPETRLSSADSSLPQQQSKLYVQLKEVMQDACFDLSHRTENGSQLIEPTAGLEHVEHKTNRQRISKKEIVIILDSDTEDDYEQNCEKKTNEKRLFSLGPEHHGDAPCVQRKRHSVETVDSQYGAAKEKLQETRWSSADSSLPQQQSKLCDVQLKEVMQDACFVLSHSTESGSQLTETNTGSEHVERKINRQRISKNENVIILDSDTEDDYEQNCKNKTNGKRLFSLGCEDGGDAPCVQRKRHSVDNVDNVDSQYGATQAKQETRRSSADSSLPQRWSELHDTQFKDVMQDAFSDLSHSIKQSVHLIDAKGESEHVQNETNRRTTSKRRVRFHDSGKVVKKDNFSKKKANTKIILSSGSEGSGDSLFETQNGSSDETVDHLFGTDNEKPENNRLSSEDSPEKQQPQSVEKEAHYPNPVIPRLVVKSSQHNHCLKLLNEPQFHRQDKDETCAPNTPTASRKKTDSCEKDMRHLYRNKLKRANDRHHATNKVQANIIKPRFNPISLPSKEGPSTSISCLSSTSGKPSEAKQSSAISGGLSQSGETSASSSLPKCKHSTTIPRQHLSPSILQRPHSYTNSLAVDQPNSPTKAQLSPKAIMQSSARKQVTKDWQKSFCPTRRDRKASLGMDGNLRTTNHNLGRDVRPGPSHYDGAPRLRHNSHESATPLMKKTKIDAIQWTKARSRDTPREQRCSVGEGYKWSLKPINVKGNKRLQGGKEV